MADDFEFERNFAAARAKAIRNGTARLDEWDAGDGANTCEAAFIKLLCAGEVAQRPVRWYWDNRLAEGKQTLVGGDPSIGKSQISNDVVARISCGLGWPDGGTAPHGNCIILSSEDAANDTICPRLELAGADLSHVHILESVRENGKARSFNLSKDLDLLDAAVERIGGVRLIVIDPLTAYLGDADSHRTADVRAVLDPFDRFAERNRCALLAITHPPKATQAKAINAFTGSLAFVANARLAFVCCEEEGSDRRLLLGVKNNLGPLAPGIGYRIVQEATGRNIVASRIDWCSMPVTVSANEAMQAANTGGKRQERQEAVRFLEGYLEDGPMPVDAVLKAATANEISEKTLRRAKDELKVKAERSGFGGDGGWTWRLPQ